MTMKYDKTIFDVEVGAFKLKIETFKSLDQTIDALCASLDHNSTQDPLSEDLCPYFGVVWPAALGLSKYLIRHRDQIKGKEILELGCGLAIPSFVAHSYGANILASDFHLDAEDFLKKNQMLNNTYFNYQRLNWRENLESPKKFDIVMGSDVLYESRHPDDVANALLKFVKPGGEIILADPGRAYLQNFVISMHKKGYKEELEPIRVDGSDIFLLRFYAP